MDVIWKKDESGLYTDIFEDIDTDTLLTKTEVGFMLGQQFNQKNSQTSTNLRLKGNKKVSEGDWYNAMLFYNKSLRYAEIDSENVSLAIANRSFRFLKLKMYDKCLIDIELAVDAKYPQGLMQKLTERRTISLELLNTQTMGAVEPKLDFAADDNYPGMANVIKMESNKKFGKHFISKCDIDVGKVLMVEKPFVTSAKTIVDSNICDACFKSCSNFIACLHCTNALFCSQSCAEDKLHKIRCRRAFAETDDELVEFVLRSIVLAINMFPNIEALREFVEKVMGENQKEVPQSLNDTQSKYRLFLKFNRWYLTGKDTYLYRGFVAFCILKKSDYFKNIFKDPNAERLERFLMHLCVFHTCIVECNSFQNQFFGCIYLLRNHFNHSCAPNVLSTFHDNKSIAITSRQIKKGDQLFISYGKMYFFEPLRERQLKLYVDFGFGCKCEKCKNPNWPISSARVKSDRIFQMLVREEKLLKRQMDEIPQFIFLKKKCIELLTKYSLWCTELDTVSHKYVSRFIH